MSLTITKSSGRKPSRPKRYHGRMDRDKFIAKCARRSRSTPEHVEANHKIERCDCGRKKCPGWVAIYRIGWRKRQA